MAPQAPSAHCDACGELIQWDGAIRGVGGKCTPLTSAYRFHLNCGDPHITDGEIDQAAIDYIFWRMSKLNRGMKTCQMKLVLVMPNGKIKTIEEEFRASQSLGGKKPVYL